MKKITIYFLAFVMLFSLIISSLKFNAIKVKANSAKASVVIEATTNRVLSENNKDVELAMASTTKIMTALVTFENCPNLDEIVKVDNRSVGIEGTSIYLRKDESLTVKELLFGLILASGNDASLALAYHVGKGSLENFVGLMNEKAKELDLKHTSFANPHGLDQKGHYTSAYDLAIITSEAMKNENFREICSTKFTQISGNDAVKTRYLRNKQRLLKTLDGCNGVKSGFTDNAGRCLVTSCKRDNMEVISVVLNCPDMFEESARLINDAFSKYKMVKILEPYNFITTIPLDEAKVNEIKVFSRKEFSYPLCDEEKTKITIEKELPDNLVAPIEKEQKVGKISVFFDNVLLFEEDILTMESAESTDIKDKIEDIIEKWFYED